MSPEVKRILARLYKERDKLVQEADRIQGVIDALDLALTALKEKETNHGLDDKKPRKQG